MTVEVELSDFPLHQLLEHVIAELENYKSRKYKYAEKLIKIKHLLDLDDFEGVRIESLDDEIKMEHLKKVFHKYSTTYIEQQLPD